MKAAFFPALFLATAVLASTSPPYAFADPLQVILERGDTLQVRRIEPAPFDMLRITTLDGDFRYVPTVRIQAVIDVHGQDRTADVLGRRGTLRAEEVPHSAHRHALCWRGHPAPECRSFLITEFGILGRIDNYPFQSGESRVAFTFDLGWMKNVSDRDAVGFSGYAFASDPSARLGIRGRYRRWLSRNTSVDLSPGVLLSGEDNIIDYDPPGLILGATLNGSDLVSLTVETEYSRFKDYGDGPFNPKSRSDVSWRAGAKLGSGLGVAGAAALFGLFLYIGLNGGFE